MRKLTPKGIIGLSTTAFLFLILMSIIYFNDQVEFNSVEAKWELSQDYQIGTFGSFTPGGIYEFEVIENAIYNSDTSETNFYNVFSNGNVTTRMIIQGSILSQDFNNTHQIHFWDENYIWLGFMFYDSFSFQGTLGQYSGVEVENIPQDAYYFGVYARKASAGEYVAVPTIVFESNEYTYDSIGSITNQDSYQVFENIRNNASTVNPLGFMNTIVSIPARAVGYYNSFTDFVTGGLGLNFRDQTFSELGDNWWVRVSLFIEKFNNPEIYGDPWDRWRD